MQMLAIINNFGDVFVWFLDTGHQANESVDGERRATRNNLPTLLERFCYTFKTKSPVRIIVLHVNGHLEWAISGSLYVAKRAVPHCALHSLNYV